MRLSGRLFRLAAGCTLSVLFGFLAIGSLSAEAAEFKKTTRLSSISMQATRPVQQSTDNHVAINFVANAPAWELYGGSGGSTCAESGAVIPANDPKMLALVLTAYASNATVHVFVDNTLPMMASLCRIGYIVVAPQ